MKFLPQQKWLRILACFGGIPLVLSLLLLGLFALNGLFLGYRTDAGVKLTNHPATQELEQGSELRIMVYNIAKGFAHKSGTNFRSTDVVKKRLDFMVEALKAEDPDLVFLSEALHECSPCPVYQVAYLAEKLEMHSVAYGENYNLGLPFYRIIGGNAILSKWPLEPVANPDLEGRKPFYVTKNNRRVLWCRIQTSGKPILMAALHNDSFHIPTNSKQAQQIVDFAKSNGDERVILAGDFNAQPHQKPLQIYKESQLFTGEWDGPHTFPADKPVRTIDYILGPKNWEVLEHKVIENLASDHRPILTVFKTN